MKIKRLNKYVHLHSIGEKIEYEQDKQPKCQAVRSAEMLSRRWREVLLPFYFLTLQPSALYSKYYSIRFLTGYLLAHPSNLIFLEPQLCSRGVIVTTGIINSPVEIPPC